MARTVVASVPLPACISVVSKGGNKGFLNGMCDSDHHPFRRLGILLIH